ncbi:MAG: efflux RND transporter periplasmic adaptor subunit [Woeseia sp.]
MKAGRFWPGLILGFFVLAACQSKGNSDGDTDEAAADTENAEDDTPAIPVETSSPTRGDIYAMYSGTAPIEAFAEADVVAKVAGEVREILVEEGDDVKSGQVLARLDGDRLRFELMQAEANLRKAQRDYQRNIDLKEKSLISAGDFEKIKYEMQALEATYNLARLELSYTEIRAPIDGVVAERFVKIGNTIAVNAITFHVASLEPLIAYLHVPEREYRRIGPGQTAVIRIDALQGHEFQADVARISPVVDPATGTFKITVEVSDPSRHLKPGMFGRVSIVYDMHAEALQIPRSAIIDEAGETAVFIVEDDKAVRRPITTGYSNNGRIEILDGLTGNEKIVVVGQAGLKDGSKVSIINAVDAEKSSASTSTSE